MRLSSRSTTGKVSTGHRDPAGTGTPLGPILDLMDGDARDRIILEGMVCHGRHGILPAERELGQPFVVDVELRLDLRPAGLSDDLAKTVDYGEVHRLAKQVVEGEPAGLTETVAERIANATLEEHPLVEVVRVKVKKPNVRLGDTVLDGSAVEILRRRP
ncbi:dihydroneopterin aldolase [soil metagenome]